MLHKMLIFKRGIGFSSSRRRNQVQPSAKVEKGIPCSNPAPTLGIDANLELIPQLESTPWNRFHVSKFFTSSASGICTLLALRLGSRTKAMKATQRPMPRKSMRAQWPVRTQMQTTTTEMVRLTTSARLKRPHRPSDIFALPYGGGITFVSQKGGGRISQEKGQNCEPSENFGKSCANS